MRQAVGIFEEFSEKERAGRLEGAGPRRGRTAQALVEGGPQHLTPSPFMSAIPCHWHPSAASGRRQSRSAQMRSMIEAGKGTARPGRDPAAHELLDGRPAHPNPRALCRVGMPPPRRRALGRDGDRPDLPATARWVAASRLWGPRWGAGHPTGMHWIAATDSGKLSVRFGSARDRSATPGDPSRGSPRPTGTGRLRELKLCIRRSAVDTGVVRKRPALPP